MRKYFVVFGVTTYVAKIPNMFYLSTLTSHDKFPWQIFISSEILRNNLSVVIFANAEKLNLRCKWLVKDPK